MWKILQKLPSYDSFTGPPWAEWYCLWVDMGGSNLDVTAFFEITIGRYLLPKLMSILRGNLAGLNQRPMVTVALTGRLFVLFFSLLSLYISVWLKCIGWYVFSGGVYRKKFDWKKNSRFKVLVLGTQWILVDKWTAATPKNSRVYALFGTSVQRGPQLELLTSRSCDQLVITRSGGGSCFQRIKGKSLWWSRYGYTGCYTFLILSWYNMWCLQR